jgi:hypothetical protein
MQSSFIINISLVNGNYDEKIKYLDCLIIVWVYANVVRMTVFWGVATNSALQIYRGFGGVYYHHNQGDAVNTSEISVNFYEITRRNIPEDSHLKTRRRENLKCHYICYVKLVLQPQFLLQDITNQTRNETQISVRVTERRGLTVNLLRIREVPC